MKLEMMKKKYNELMEKQIELGRVMFTGNKEECARDRETWNRNHERLMRMKKSIREKELAEELEKMSQSTEYSAYIYGMRLREFSPACQPMDGLTAHREDESGEYYDILTYNRPLTKQEIDNYELQFITATK